MDDYKIKLESLMYAYYIKYDVLEQLMNDAFDITSDKIDVYIDVFDMLKGVYKRQVSIEKKLLIVSGLVNLAAHMRRFYWTRYGVMTRIYLVYGTNESRVRKHFYQSFGENNDSYKDTLEYDNTNSYIESQLELLKILVAYIEGVYLVKRTTNCSMFIYENISKNMEIPAVVITKDKLCYQIPALFDNTVILRPCKKNTEDISYYINKSNVILKSFKTNNEKTINYLSTLDSGLLSILFTCVGLYEYNLKAMCNITITSRLLSEAVTNNKIINGYNSDTDYIYDNLPGIAKYADPVTFKYRFNAVDLPFQYRIYGTMAESRDISWLIDLHDPETVRNINNQYFIDNPLDLNGL